MPPFISGLKFSKLFFKEAVQPILQSHFPRLRYAAAQLGYRSKVLGFDDEMSRDHDWDAHFTLYVPHEDLGYPTNWTLPHEDGI